MDGPRVVMRGWSVLTLPHGRNSNTVGPGQKDAVGHRHSLLPGGMTLLKHTKRKPDVADIQSHTRLISVTLIIRQCEIRHHLTRKMVRDKYKKIYINFIPVELFSVYHHNCGVNVTMETTLI